MSYTKKINKIETILIENNKNVKAAAEILADSIYRRIKNKKNKANNTILNHISLSGKEDHCA